MPQIDAPAYVVVNGQPKIRFKIEGDPSQNQPWVIDMDPKEAYSFFASGMVTCIQSGMKLVYNAGTITPGQAISGQTTDVRPKTVINEKTNTSLPKVTGSQPTKLVGDTF